MGISRHLPSGNPTVCELEAMDLIEIDDLPMNSMVMFHSYVNVYQRVTNSMIFLGVKSSVERAPRLTNGMGFTKGEAQVM
jgi:hypothetical protein